MISDYILENAAENISTLGENVEFRYSSFDGILAPRPLSSVWLETKSGLGIKMNVWSDPGSPAALSGAVCDQPPLPSDNCSVAFVHINSWIQDCLMNHKKCQYTISGNLVDEIHGSKLPTRVLDLGCADNTADLSLIETQDERASYCALSYCWGSSGMNHLLTTRANIKFHFDCIKFDQLPRTLQDAVIVTRKIGIRYLWIDSLCIIQGDKADWTAESAKMAEVYQNAYLVIAASGAAHPGEGCFSKERRRSTSAEIPYFSEALQMMGSIRLSMHVRGEDSPQFGPLWNRGWAMQERMLARRMLHFMPGGLSWKCGNLQSGERYPYDMQQYSQWAWVVDFFSHYQLTYKEDRLAALEGLGRAVQEANGDRYTFGILESQLPELLLWVTEDDVVDISEDLVSVPTWCWASKGGPKIFWSVLSDLLAKYGLSDAEMTIENSGALRMKGVLQECKVSDAEIDGSELENLDPRLCDHFERDRTLYLFEGSSAASGVRGIAAFDHEYSETVNVLFLNELLYNDNTRPEQVVYAALLLTPDAGEADSFRRIGMAFANHSSGLGNLASALQVIRII